MLTKVAVVINALLWTLTIGGCATQSATSEPSAATTMYGSTGYGSTGTADAADMTGQRTAGMYAGSEVSARPRLNDFVVHDDVRDIHFDFDSYAIRPADATALEASTQWLKAHPESLLVIEGHADERGTGEYNVALGERRAKASMTYLVSRGIQANRITVVSYGEERGMCRDKTEACWSKNRRAHFLVKLR